MHTNLNQSNTSWKFLWLIALCGLPVLGWLGVLDNFSSEQVSKSISSAGLIYGTARGINALVSLLQGTELDLVFLTFSIGEILDPINDLIERFSGIILVALGSLALQNILLAVVSHTMFNTLLTILAVATGFTLMSGNQRLFEILLRSFFVIAFFRFSLGLVVMANSWVDASFLDTADQQRHVAMENFQGELREIDMLAKRQDESEAAIALVNQQLAQLALERKNYQESIKTIDTEISASEKRLEALANKGGKLCAISIMPGISIISPTCPDPVKAEKRQLDELLFRKETVLAGIEAVEETTDQSRESLTCLSKRQRGENCSIWEGLPSVPNPAALQAKMGSINDNLGDFADNIVNLLVSLLLKTVVIPLLFFFVLLKIVRINWERLR